MRVLVLLMILSSLAGVMTLRAAHASREVENDPVIRDVQSGIALERSLIKHEIADAVARREIGLLEAAARFLDLTVGDPRAVVNLHLAFPGRTDNERCARAVISYVRGHLCENGNDKVLADRLTEELERHLVSGAFEGDWKGYEFTDSFPRRW